MNTPVHRLIPIAAVGLSLIHCSPASTPDASSGDGTMSSTDAADASRVDHVAPTDTMMSADHPDTALPHDVSTPDVVRVPTDGGPSSSRLTERQLGSVSGAPNGYYEYLPPGYDGTTAAPLLVFWHGIGEDGNGSSDLHNVLAWGPAKVINQDHWDNSRPFIVLAPQYTSSGNGGIAPGAGCPSSATIHDFFQWAIGHYNVDPHRVYLSGLSCGAIGSWDYLGNFPGQTVAAAVLLSGNPGTPTDATSSWGRANCSLATTAIWSFHGDADSVVPYQPDHDTVQNLMGCAMPPRRDVQFTDVVGGGHIIWDPIYDLSGGYGDIYAWMLTQSLP